MSRLGTSPDEGTRREGVVHGVWRAAPGPRRRLAPFPGPRSWLSNGSCPRGHHPSILADSRHSREPAWLSISWASMGSEGRLLLSCPAAELLAYCEARSRVRWDSIAGPMGLWVFIRQGTHRKLWCIDPLRWVPRYGFPSLGGRVDTWLLRRYVCVRPCSFGPESSA